MEDGSLSTGTKKLQAVTYSKYVTKVQIPSFSLPGNKLLMGNKAPDFSERLGTCSVVDAMA